MDHSDTQGAMAAGYHGDRRARGAVPDTGNVGRRAGSSELLVNDSELRRILRCEGASSGAWRKKLTRLYGRGFPRQLITGFWSRQQVEDFIAGRPAPGGAGDTSPIGRPRPRKSGKLERLRRRVAAGAA